MLTSEFSSRFLNREGIVNEETESRKYHLIAPEGGWGYFVMAAFTIYIILSSAQLDSYGLVYGDFLLQITGDKAYGIALTHGIMFTIQSYTGFLAHLLVHYISFRQIGLIGASLYFIGSLSSIIMQNLVQMIFCVSVCQGIGLSLLSNALYSSFYSYFKKRANMMMGISQSIIIVGITMSPYAVEQILSSLGFRGMLWVIAALASLTFILAGLLDPIEKHLIKSYIDIEMTNPDLSRRKSSNVEDYKKTFDNEPIGTPNEKCHILKFDKKFPIKKMWLEIKKSWEIMDFSLFRSFKYWSVALGVSAPFFCDFGFLTLIPAILGDIGFSMSDIVNMMIVHLACDLVGRISYSVINIFYKTRNRYVYYVGDVITFLVRILFSLDNSYNWRIATLAVLGYMRGFMQVTFSLCLAEEFEDKFASAFSLMFVICGTGSLITASVASFVKHYTKSNLAVLHLYTLPLIICIFLWPIEYLYQKKQRSLNKI